MMDSEVKTSNRDSTTLMSNKHPTETHQTSIAHNLESDRKRTADVILNADPVNQDSKPMANMRFVDLQLSPLVLQGLGDAGFVRPSPVQIKAIPLGRLGMDLIVQAKSGTGKTVVFAVVILEAIDTKRNAIQALVVSPTREIAFQSQTVIQQLGAHIPGLKCHLFVGGLPLTEDLRHLSDCHIAIGTPGRLRYLLESDYLITDSIRQFVLDEADLLLSGGADAKLTGGSANNAFPADINFIWWNLPQAKQVLALSATYTDYLIHQHLPRYMNNPALVRLTSEDPALLGVRQFFHLLKPPSRVPASIFAAKVAFLCKLLGEIEFQQCLIFSNFHSSAQDLCDALHSRGWPVSYISSSLGQGERFQAFNRLRAFQCRVLVSTDLTSRGIDAENVNLVISLEVPWEHETYVHRVGRAGRFGSYGASILVVADIPEECSLLKRLESKCPTKIRQLPDPIPTDLAAPECPIELDSLITVVNCLGQTNLDPNLDSADLARLTRPLSRKKTPKVRTPALRQKTTQQDMVDLDEHQAPVSESPLNSRSTESVCDAVSNEISSQENWVAKLSEYLDIMDSNPNGSFWPILVENLPIKHDQQQSIENLLLLENEVLDKLDQELNSNPHHQTLVNDQTNQANRRTYELNRAKFDKPLAGTPVVDAKPKLKRQDKPRLSQPIQDFQLGTDSDRPFEWTQRQLAAWYEYHQLKDYARYYHAAWLSAVGEYNAALEDYEKLKNSLNKQSSSEHL